MSILVVSALLGYVVPQIVQVFEDMGGELPLVTRILISVSGFFQHYFVYLFIGIILSISGASYILRQPGPRYKYDRFLLGLPAIGRFVRGVNTSRFARTLSILAASGVPVLEALRIAGSVVSNMPMREAVKTAAHKVREGAPLARSLEQSGYFTPMTVNLIASGEVSGNLEEMLERASINQEREQEMQISFMMGMMEPLLIVVMGMVVMFIVMGTLLPIFDMKNLIK